MNYLRDAFDLPPLALTASALALFVLGALWGGAVLGAILATSAAIGRELALYRIDGRARLEAGD